MLKNMKERMYISTVCEKVEELAKKYGCGIEVANFSYAENMDTYFDETKKKVDEYVSITNNLVFHAPFYEITMCAIDPLARDFAMKRLKQFYDIAKVYMAKKLILHTGYIHPGYFKEWFIPKTAEFLNEFVKEIEKNNCANDMHSGSTSENNSNFSIPDICIENVLETDPYMFYEIMKKIDNDKVKICIDVGHVNVYSDRDLGNSGHLGDSENSEADLSSQNEAEGNVSKNNVMKNNVMKNKGTKNNSTELVLQWIEVLSPYISHFHLHNNYGDVDRHLDINDGELDINKIIAFAEKKINKPTYTFEVIDVKSELPINKMTADI